MYKLKYSKRHDGVFQYKTNKGIKWGYRLPYYDSFHKRKESQKRGFNSEMDAYRARLNEESKVFNYQSELVENRNITLKQYAEMFLETRTNSIKISSLRIYKKDFQKLVSLIGDRKLSKLNKTIYVKEVINELVSEGYKKNSIKSFHNRMMTLVNSAVDDGIIDRNRLSGIKIPETGKREKRIMTKDELRQFNQQLSKEKIRDQVCMTALEETGMRQGELCGLKWEDVDFKTLKINVRRTRDSLGPRTPKTPSSKREISISVKLASLLKSYRLETSQKFLKHGKKFNDQTYILQSNLLNPIQTYVISTTLSKILKHAKLDYLVGHFTPHTFRHQFASYLLNSGVPLTEISKTLGHSNPSITLSIYSEAAPDKNDNLAQKFNELW
ncbi:site-specific integrase (plasmid) [Fructilactobacillus ixorae]|uniref:Site-specific integrase n=1 Tax=Fructilactobacillus ixorae TaxID=1750535 RepID=A0ABY5C814_9LACO|nr:tyrosine-type recombinase/integrase [Fructilactobacillus ixorae]USS93958.1 site-specific integrase [Fructilactobacillus ixorae]